MLSGDDVLDFVGVADPTPADRAWATQVAQAIEQAIAGYLDLPDPAYNPFLEPEIAAAARLAASEAWRRRDAPFGTTGFLDPATGGMVRLARDYLEGVKPILARYRSVRGLVA